MNILDKMKFAEQFDWKVFYPRRLIAYAKNIQDNEVWTMFLFSQKSLSPFGFQV